MASEKSSLYSSGPNLDASSIEYIGIPRFHALVLAASLYTFGVAVMYSLLAALTSSCTDRNEPAEPSRSIPVVRWASSQSTRSNDMPARFWARTTASMLWYVENTTVIESGSGLSPADIRSGSVVTGISISLSGMSVFSPWLTLGSEHTPTYECGIIFCSAQYRMVCRINEMDGTAYSTSPPFPTISSAILSEVSVLPVPQAIIIWPRSSRFAVTVSTASR